MFQSLFLLSLVTSIVAAIPAPAAPPYSKRQLAATPVVTITNGTVRGTTTDGVEFFNGIPFAVPPTGRNRLTVPKVLQRSFGTVRSVRTPAACPQFLVQSGQRSAGNLTGNLGGILNNPLVTGALKWQEDCLTLNVQRPASTTVDSKLPVLFWIYGGGFELGGTQQYGGDKLIRRSVALGAPVLFIECNYRVGAYGFLAGKELATEGATNLGLKDQRLCLQWTQDNIAAFGGDPDKVTIWGESAGAISVYDHLIINGGDHTYKGKAMFRGAIMNSGSVIPAVPVNHPKPQAVYDQVVREAGCQQAANTLNCLRSKRPPQFLAAANSLPGLLSYNPINLAYLPRPDPSDNFLPESPEIAGLGGKFAKVPFIIGDQEDEGTLFSLFQQNVTTPELLTDYVKSYFPDAKPGVVEDYVQLYPEDVAAGSPFGSGTQSNPYPQFKRLAAILGDLTFTLSRRTALQTASKVVPAWSYLNTFIKAPLLGTFHGGDLLYLFGITKQTENTFPAQVLQTTVISFANTLDPNGLKMPGLVAWPKYGPDARLLNVGNATTALMVDDFRKAQSDFLTQNVESFRV